MEELREEDLEVEPAVFLVVGMPRVLWSAG